jgi:hypothetical protein
MEQHLLSFVSDEKGEQVTVHMDKNGIYFLINTLQKLLDHLEEGECEHDHLFTKEWGSDELTSTKAQNLEDEHHQIHHVKFYAWTDEWKIKNRLAKE